MNFTSPLVLKIRTSHISAITAVIAKAPVVVNVTSQVNGYIQFSRSHHPKTISAIKMKFGVTDYVQEGNPQSTFGNNQITGGFIMCR